MIQEMKQTNLLMQLYGYHEWLIGWLIDWLSLFLHDANAITKSTF